MRDLTRLIERFPALKRVILKRVPHHIPVMRQMAATDCGSAALGMVLGYYGRPTPLSELRKAIGAGRSGSSVASIIRVGDAYGLRGRAVRMDMEDLQHLPSGTILHWQFRHFVVFQRANRRTIDVVDPAVGRRSITRAAFRRAFTGVAIIFEPTEAFQPAAANPRRMSGFLKQLLDHRSLIARLISTSVVVQILSATVPLLTGVLIDRVVPHNDYSLLLVLAVAYCALQLFSAVAAFVRTHLSIHLRTQLEAAFTLRFLDHLVDLPYAFFQQRTSGDLMVRLGSNSAVREILTSSLFSTVLDGLMASIYLILLMLMSPRLTLIVISLAVTRLGLLALMRWKQHQLLSENLENQARSQTYQVEMLSGMETLKAMGLEHRAAEKWSNLFVDGLNISIKRGRLDAIFNASLTLVGSFTTLTLMFYGAYSVLQGQWTLGSMMAFSGLASGFLTPLNSLVSSGLQLQMLETYIERLNDVLEAPVEQDRNKVSLCPTLTGAVTLTAVSFRYSPHDPLILNNVSIIVDSGSRVALVGRTGSGKSTLVRVLAGLYEPNSGSICFDGEDLKCLDRRSLRRQLGIVTQDTHLFGCSIRQNIALSDADMSLDRVVEAARMACIHDDIMAMARGYETVLTDSGRSLSGGQRQRLAIARALASAPKILILDEGTSHLDAVTEDKLNRNLASLRCTRIVIAHRLSTTRDADLIIVLNSGKVIEQGPHEELLTAGGEYSELVRAQQDWKPPAIVYSA